MTMVLRNSILLAASCLPIPSHSWDIFRFAKQSSQFITFAPAAGGRARTLRPGDSLGELRLYPLDDVVMGGSSASTFDNARRRWSGDVIEANGGFVGCRTKALSPALDVSSCGGLALTVSCPSKLRFKCVLRDSTDFNGIAHTASFDTAGTAGQVVRLPFASFVATRFAKTVPGARLDAGSVVGFQLALSKFEYDGKLNPLFREGAFELELSGVAVY